MTKELIELLVLRKEIGNEYGQYDWKKQLIDLAAKPNCRIDVFLEEKKWFLCNDKTNEEWEFEVNTAENGEQIAKILDKRSIKNDGDVLR